MFSSDSTALTLTPTAGSGSQGPLVEVTDLHKYYYARGRLLSRMLGRELAPVRAVDGVSFTVSKGETLGLVGESGSGKSTVGRLVLRLEEPTSGSVRFGGEDLAALSRRQLRGRRKQFQMVFQDPYSSLNPRMRVGEMLSEVLIVHGSYEKSAVQRRVMELLALVEMPTSAARFYPAHFSGGQRQRIGIARAIAVGPKLIVADEPVSALDVSVQSQILNLIGQLKRELDLTWIFISHNLAVVRQTSERVAVMYLGQFVEIGASRILYERPLHPYTISLLAAVPIPDPAAATAGRRISQIGEAPSAVNLPRGCRFHPRCWLREKLGNPVECESVAPPLRELGPEQSVACHFAERVSGSIEQGPASSIEKVEPRSSPSEN